MKKQTKTDAQKFDVRQLVRAGLPSLRRLDDLKFCLYKRGYRDIYAEYLGAGSTTNKEFRPVRTISLQLRLPKRIMDGTGVDQEHDECWISHCLTQDLQEACYEACLYFMGHTKIVGKKRVDVVFDARPVP